MVPMGLAGPSEVELRAPARSQAQTYPSGAELKRIQLPAKMPSGTSDHPMNCPEFYYLGREIAAQLGTMVLGLVSHYQACQGNTW